MAPAEESHTCLPSMESRGPEVVVKNTFIEVKVDEESTPVPRDRQRRAKTQPQVAFDGALTEDEVTDSDLAVGNFVSEDGTSEQEEVFLVRAATEQLARSRRPEGAVAAEALDQPVPQFGSGDLKVIVKNTFLDVDLATPSVRRTRRSKTAPNKQSLPFADVGFEGHTLEVESAQEEEEETEPAVERVVTRDWYESPEAWEWVPGMRMPLELRMMMIYPKIANSTRPGVSFKTSSGKGYIQLKCEAELSQSVAGVVLRLSLGDGSGDGQAPRGPVLHDFLSSGVCGLPKGQEIWDFSSAVDKGSMTFSICLEIAASKGS